MLLFQGDKFGKKLVILLIRDPGLIVNIVKLVVFPDLTPKFFNLFGYFAHSCLNIVFLRVFSIYIFNLIGLKSFLKPIIIKVRLIFLKKKLNNRPYCLYNKAGAILCNFEMIL